MAEDPLKQRDRRCFLAIPLQELFREELEIILGPLRQGISGVRWVKPSQVHLTLHFFGAISENDIPCIDASMQNVAVLSTPLRMALDRLGGFPDLTRPSIIWLGLAEKTGALFSFQKAVTDAVKRLGFGVESRPFHPHVTIGRVKDRSGDLKTFADKVPFRFPTLERTADHFVLYQSHCLPEGARYEILKTYPMQKKAQA